jgi:hypothetical protein
VNFTFISVQAYKWFCDTYTLVKQYTTSFRFFSFIIIHDAKYKELAVMLLFPSALWIMETLFVLAPGCWQWYSPF